MVLAVAVSAWMLSCDDTVNRARSGPRSDLDSRLTLEAGPAGDGARAAPEAGASRDAGLPSAHDCKNPHPAWLLCEDFEGMAGGFDAWLSSSVWTDNIGAGDPGRMTSSTEAHTGSYALYMPAASSAGYQGATLTWRACEGANQPGCNPLKGYPRLYLRAYFRLAADHLKVHHFLNVFGGPLDDFWAPYGNAGCRPNGRRHMSTTVDFKEGSHQTFFYT